MTTNATAGRVTALRMAISVQVLALVRTVPPIAAVSFGGMGCGRADDRHAQRLGAPMILQASTS
jgi:hypothetical protein